MKINEDFIEKTLTGLLNEVSSEKTTSKEGHYTIKDLEELDIRLDETFSNWMYTPPKDPEQLLYDFYFFTFFANGKVDTGNVKLDQSLADGLNKAVSSLRIHLLQVLKYGMSGELDYLEQALKENIDPSKPSPFSERTNVFIKKYLKLHNDETISKYDSGEDVPLPADKKKLFNKDDFKYETTSLNSYSSVLRVMEDMNMTNLEFARVAQELFTKINWPESYGGTKWGEIAKTYEKLLTSARIQDMMVWIDHVYDLQHNDGSILDKLNSYEKGDSHEWIKNALDWKRDVREMKDFYPKVSPQLKSIVAYVSKNVYDKAIS